MRLDEFTDSFIAKIVASACNFFNTPEFYEKDCEQAAYLAAYQLRQRLNDRYSGCHLLSQRNIYLSVRRSIAIALRKETNEHGKPILDDEYASKPHTPMDYSDLAILKGCLALCDKRERKVLRYYFWEEMTQDEIGKKMKLSHQWVGKIIENAIKKMQATSNEHITLRGKPNGNYSDSNTDTNSANIEQSPKAKQG